MEKEMGERARGFCTLGIAAFILRALMVHIRTAVIEAIPAHKEYAAKVGEHGMHTGALSYNDVPRAAEGELPIRNAIRFAPRKDVAGQ